MKSLFAKIRLSWVRFLVKFPKFDIVFVAPFDRFTWRERQLLERRPHRSFRRTRRRDYVRSLAMPGYWAQTVHVWRHLKQYKKVFFYLALVYAILSAVLLGLASQDTFNQLSGFVKQTNFFTGGWQNLGQAGLLFFAAVTGGLNSSSASGAQGIFSILLVLMIWLTTVWLIRTQLAGKNPRLRDGLYQAGSPIISLFIVMFYGILQLIPAALGVIMVSAVIGYGDQAGGLGMLVWVVVVLLAILSLYWLTSTFIALVVVTLPGMYPWRAVQIAGDLVIGRRIRILLRVLWGFFITLLAWIVIMIPTILLYLWLSPTWKWLSNVPVVPIVLLLLTTGSLLWLAAYIYMLYRRIVDDNSPPA